ncbi:SDR family NAD(P)-dependent oxidoreductase [Bradyrhizobium sp. McL0615]|uniref:SDR family NAD(P)-dependent oxidoreductase n=1 Tax=Bradyrhizobium sp. McL0615 TaxID=3415673 RepID=UPI003CEFAC05
MITGASRGIGRAIALRFAEEGCHVAVAATSVTPLEEVAELARQIGVKASVQNLDVTMRSDCFNAVEKVRSELGGLDILVNAAGIARTSSFVDYAEADFRAVFDVNVYGPIHLMQAVLPHMQRRQSGKIVNIASTAGKWASPNQSAYNASKHALVGLTRCIALEAAPFRINVNAICPGLVQTEMLTNAFGQLAAANDKSLDEILAPILARTAMKRILDPSEIAALAVYLASSESDGMTGQSIVIDSGMLFI